MAWNDNIGFGEWIGRSTFNGKRYGLEIKNKKFEIMGVDILIIDKEKELVKEERVYYNLLSVLEQICKNLEVKCKDE
ncbi:hypothetical protein WIW89_06365 [Stygiolobus sp. CP850M]|uniref:Uncharacterized protein n=1 Tax=Saccharolobus islandicus (strain L.D.8.5 / Lassen \|nr:hypothetical protein [Sulfolobus islandicus]ADB87466.1 hypothetical protein LD85_1805 [Sulfolobus islandicus L.D.8.5]